MEINPTQLEFDTRRLKDGSSSGGRKLRFYIMDAPAPSTLPAYIKELQKHHVKHLVRVCTQTYRADAVQMAQIETHAFPFDDGAPPPPEVIGKWLSLVDGELEAAVKANSPDCAPIAVHCVAGLGRAPILVAVALVEYGEYAPLDAIGFVRERRKGAINQVQLNWLVKYKPRGQQRAWGDVCCAVQ